MQQSAIASAHDNVPDAAVGKHEVGVCPPEDVGSGATPTALRGRALDTKRLCTPTPSRGRGTHQISVDSPLRDYVAHNVAHQMSKESKGTHALLSSACCSVLVTRCFLEVEFHSEGQALGPEGGLGRAVGGPVG